MGSVVLLSLRKNKQTSPTPSSDRLRLEADKEPEQAGERMMSHYAAEPDQVKGRSTDFIRNGQFTQL